MRATAVLLTMLLTAGSTAAGPVDGAAPRPTAPSAAPTEAAEPAPGAAKACPVTLPNGQSPPGQATRQSHGNGRLWVLLYPRGIVRTHPDNVEKDGSLAAKFPWTRGVRGHLVITGRRLDAAGPPLRSSVPRGYGRIGFQSTAVIFPAAGCWEVTGRVGGVTVTFVTRVKPPPAAASSSPAA